jgi:hypothetical protein
MKKFLIIISILLFCLSCKDKKTFLPKVTGASGEVLVIMTDWQWKGNPGVELARVLNSTYPGLPQEERMFDIIRIRPNSFSNLYKQYRNIILVKIDERFTKGKISVSKNRWASTQLVLTLLASSDAALTKLIGDNNSKIKSIINKAERERIIALYKAIPDRHVNDILLQKHNIRLAIPKSYTLNVDSTDFTWLSCEQSDIIQGILIYQYKSSDTGINSEQDLIVKRDQFLKKYVYGSVDGSYMATEKIYPPIFKAYYLENQITYELRGLWRLENGIAMGGPFVSITEYDKSNKRFITLEGFVYAPAHKKREYLRKVEAIILSVELQ